MAVFAGSLSPTSIRAADRMGTKAKNAKTVGDMQAYLNSWYLCVLLPHPFFLKYKDFYSTKS